MAFSPESFADFSRTINRALGAAPLDEEQQEMAALVRDEVISNFNREEDSSGSAWAPRTRKYNHLPLRLSYKMYGAATVKGAPGSIETRSRQELTVGISGADVEYAAAQNYGAENAGKYRNATIPAREFMYVRKVALKTVAEPLDGAMGKVLDKQIKHHQA